MMQNLDHRMQLFGGLQLLVVIVDRSGARRVEQVLHTRRGPLFRGRAFGTAGTEIAEVLGLDSPEKALLFGFYHGHHIPVLQGALRERAGMKKPGKGISFSVPLSGMTIPFHRHGYDSGGLQTLLEERADEMNDKLQHDLVIAVVEEDGYEQVMGAARSAGATGGTTFHVLRLGTEQAARFFGFPIQSKRDVVAILTPRRQKKAILEAISALPVHGERSVVFSLPADNVMGLGLQDGA